MVQKEVLDKIDSDRLAVLVVWVPILDGDSREAALMATGLLSDKRVRHFWDPEMKVALAFGKMIQSAFGKAVKLPKEDYPAWDVYLVFEATTKWKDTVPVPASWMHQLPGLDEKRKLDGGKLRESVGKLLKAKEANGDDKQPDRPWRSLPLIKDGKVDPNWVHIGWGSFAVDGDSLRTECDEKGMGLLLYQKEKFGDCQIRVVYRSKDAKSNAGVFVRIDDGILAWLNEKPAAIRRERDGKLSEASFKQLMDASEKEQGAWYPVHHGYEVQICDASDEYHRTGAIYSLAKAAAVPAKRPDDWRTLVITLQGNLVLVDLDGKRVTTFDPNGKDVPKDRKWFEPKREPKRPRSGYLGLQNHDPGDVVYFKEVSVRRLDDAP